LPIRFIIRIVKQDRSGGPRAGLSGFVAEHQRSARHSPAPTTRGAAVRVTPPAS
jgi:hypothetical protein